jgi:hypothetical protein
MQTNPGKNKTLLILIPLLLPSLLIGLMVYHSYYSLTEADCFKSSPTFENSDLDNFLIDKKEYSLLTKIFSGTLLLTPIKDIPFPALPPLPSDSRALPLRC